jgi:hypothetical protein
VGSDALQLLRPAPEGTLRLREVSTRVNSVKSDDPGCLDARVASADAPTTAPKRATSKRTAAPNLTLFDDTSSRSESDRARPRR